MGKSIKLNNDQYWDSSALVTNASGASLKPLFYDSDKTYNKNEVVLYNTGGQGSEYYKLYICKTDNVRNALPTNTSYWELTEYYGTRTITVSNNFSGTIQVKDSLGVTSNISAYSSKSWTVKNGEAIGVCCQYGGASQWIYDTGTVNKTYTVNISSTQDWVTTNIITQYLNTDISFRKKTAPYMSYGTQTPSVFNRSSLATHVRLYDPESNTTYEAQIPGDVPNNWGTGEIKYTYDKCWSVSSNSKYISFFVEYEDDPDYTNQYTTLGVSNNSSSSSEPYWTSFTERYNTINIVFGYYKTSYTIAWS